jgi:hypothetical protein
MLAYDLLNFFIVGFNTCSKGKNQMANKKTVHLPTDYQNLSDLELKLSILEYLKNDGPLIWMNLKFHAARMWFAWKE